MEYSECVFVPAVWADHLSRSQGAYLPLLSTKLPAMVCSKHPLLTSLFSFCCCFSVLLKQRIRTCQTGNTGKHFRRGVNEGLLLYGLWHLLSCWAHVEQLSLICWLCSIKANGVHLKIWWNGSKIWTELWWRCAEGCWTAVLAVPSPLLGQVAQSFLWWVMRRKCQNRVHPAIRLDLPLGEKLLMRWGTWTNRPPER